MGRKFAKLQSIDHNEVSTSETNEEFHYLLRSALLLALRERGRLNAKQYRYAEEKLKEQRIKRTTEILGRGEFNG